MNIRYFSSKKPFIHITGNAWNKIISVCKKQESPGFLFSALGGGCNGFNYNLNLINKNEFDNLLSTNKYLTVMEKANTHVIIEPLSDILLLGTTIDYITENFSENIYDSKFIFTPDEKFASSCGCGISFNPR
tara:strand:- start:299 stop:694 length:396 start_codon:yes stop_codon:yes gene_type:complete